MEGECGANNIALTEKHESGKDDKDEVEKAMKLFGLTEKNKKEVKKNGR